jgi:hypothetical protein
MSIADREIGISETNLLIAGLVCFASKLINALSVFSHIDHHNLIVLGFHQYPSQMRKMSINEVISQNAV